MLVMLDTRQYTTKPDRAEIGRITVRLQRAGYVDVTPEELHDAIREGYTFVGAAYEPSGEGWGEFAGQQLFGLDFDNVDERHEPLDVCDCFYIWPRRALSRCKKLGLPVLFAYETMHCSESNLRFRVVIDLGEPLEDESDSREFIAYLLEKFPEADQSCKNPNRLFFPSNGKLYDVSEWR